MASTPEENEKEKARSVSVDLNNDASLLIDIPDALCERDKVKFTVHTKTTLGTFQKSDFSVPRQHEDFIWLHDTLVETEDYAGLIKMHKLGEGETTMTKEEYTKMKQELEAEYLAVFKKTVQVHEIFLQRLSSHPVLSTDRNFQIFLEYDQDLSVRRKNAKEMFGGFFKNMVKTADEVIISGIKANALSHHARLMLIATTNPHVLHDVADDYIHVSATLNSLSAEDNTPLKKHLEKLADLFEKLRKVEGRVASDQELKLTELLRYYMRDIQAAKDLLYRRARALADYENSNKALDKARLKSKDVAQAEEHQRQCLQKFDRLSESGKKEQCVPAAGLHRASEEQLTRQSCDPRPQSCDLSPLLKGPHCHPRKTCTNAAVGCTPKTLRLLPMSFPPLSALDTPLNLYPVLSTHQRSFHGCRIVSFCQSEILKQGPDSHIFRFLC
ncbi:hypothetical protein JZ751_006372 [Albula glossodonta]|uniref:Sorting nexin 6 n=1 Tax=Albula glossodonta TaxID=121402 RepID=A0A8T2NB24_9TELE|nr:hypothetical protein JZ751_006372 [Albula glossodonta]